MTRNRFQTAMTDYRNAYLTGQGFYLLNWPGDIKGTAFAHDSFETMFDMFVGNAKDAGLLALTTPVSDPADMADKLAIYEQQGAGEWFPGEIDRVVRQLIADAQRLSDQRDGFTKAVDGELSAKASAPDEGRFIVVKGEVEAGLTFLAAAKAGLTGLDDIIMGGTEIRPVLLSALVESLLGLMVDAERYAKSASQMLDAVDDGGAK